MMRPIVAFDADVLIYAAAVGHPYQERIFKQLKRDTPGYGSVLLLNEVLTKPMRMQPDSGEIKILMAILEDLELLAYTMTTAKIGLALGVSYGLRPADAVHLATAVEADADIFVTNNRKDFPKTISEVKIVYPEDL